MELSLGDKLWMHYGPSVLIVGYIVEVSPNNDMIGMSPLPFDAYKKMSMEQKASCPISWCETRACHYLCHIPHKELIEQDEKVVPKAGFGFP
jgi:hypothetical protein